ncbi:MAG: DUF6683 family protein, partial [Pacificimonas sp.]
ILHKQKMKAVYGGDGKVDASSPSRGVAADAKDDGLGHAPVIAGGNRVFTAALGRNGADIPVAALSYRPDSAISRQTRARFYSVGAAASDDRLRQRVQENVAGQYGALARTLDLKRGNLADTMATYMLVNWAAANPPAELDGIENAHAAAVRDQMRALMAGQAALATDSARQEADEELVHLTALTSMMTRGERAKGAVERARFADLIRREWQARYGQDLRKLRLGPAGFVPDS